MENFKLLIEYLLKCLQFWIGIQGSIEIWIKQTGGRIMNDVDNWKFSQTSSDKSVVKRF